MALTEEQKKRIEENRQKALELQRRLKLERAQQLQGAANATAAGNTKGRTDGSKRGAEEEAPVNAKRTKTEKKAKDNMASFTEEDLDLEEFEVGASDLVTKSEAKKMYCLPDGTLEVCGVVEKDNPHRKGWAKMKLYHRSELRKRARKRFGGKDGLIAERKRREEERFQKDFERTKNFLK